MKMPYGVGGQFQVWRFNNILPPGVVHEGKDRIFMPQVAWTTADMDGHDIVREDSGRILFVNTLYSCVAALSDTRSGLINT
jgi:hypothetical protein